MAGGQAYSFSLGLDIVPITTDPENLQDMYRLYNAVKGLAIALDSAAGTISRPTEDWATAGVSSIRQQNMSRFYCKFSETVGAGHIVSFWNNAGVTTARKAGGASLAGGLGMGFVVAPVNSGDFGEVFLSGVNASIAGLTPGLTYDLSSSVAGLVTTSASSPYKQTLGFALTDKAFWFQPSYFAR